MKVAGIISEFNPFHNGHELIIRKAKEAGYTHVISVMSGNFVQRGEPALIHHSGRTRAALECGADLVLQLPSVYAVSSAQSFARAGVAILNGTGCADALVFGSECGSTEKIVSAAHAVYSDELGPLLSQELEKGISFASARENALRKINPESADIIQSPNNILGVEYVAALKKINSNIEPLTFARVGAEHDSANTDGKIASASLIREKIRRGEGWGDFVPEKAAGIYREFPVADIAKIENAVLYKIRTSSSLSQAPDVSEGIENRILAAAKQATSLEELYSLAKTKRYSHARIRRIILNHFLTVTARDLRISAPYIRALGFNQNGSELLRKMKKTAYLPVITKASDVAGLGENVQRIFLLECLAGDIFALCTQKNLPCGTEKDFKPIVL